MRVLADTTVQFSSVQSYVRDSLHLREEEFNLKRTVLFFFSNFLYFSVTIFITEKESAVPAAAA